MLIRKRVNESKNLFATDNDRIDLLLWLDEIFKDLKTTLKYVDIKICRHIIMLEISIQYLESCNELITHLIALISILKYIVKVEKILELGIEKLEQKEINELTVLKKKIFIMTLRNKYLGKSNYEYHN